MCFSLTGEKWSVRCDTCFQAAHGHRKRQNSMQAIHSLFHEIVKVTQSCPTLCDPMDCIVPGILQARMLEWVAFAFSRGSSQPRDQTQVSCISWATREALQWDKFWKYLCLGLKELEKEMATHSSVLENPRDGKAWWAAIYGVTQSRTWLKQLSSSSRPEGRIGTPH